MDSYLFFKNFGNCFTINKKIIYIYIYIVWLKRSLQELSNEYFFIIFRVMVDFL